MAHLIQPITIDGTAYCCKCYGVSEKLGRGTEGVLTDNDFALDGETNKAVITNDCSPWDLLKNATIGYEPEGEISFGVSCGTYVNIDFVSSGFQFGSGTGSITYSIDVEVFVDGVGLGSFNMTHPSSTTETVIFSVIGGPCGTIVTLYAKSLASGGSSSTWANLTAEVTSIT